MTTIFGSVSVETPKYTVVKALDNAIAAELRKYGPQVRAEVLYDVSPNHGIMDGTGTPFRALAGYIFGGNTSRSRGGSEKVAMTAPVVVQTTRTGGPSSEKIAMTAPVVMQGSGDGNNKHVMYFIMPSKYKGVADLPVPKDSRVRLFEVPERTFAVIRFNGRMNSALATTKEQELRTAATKEGVKLSDDPHAVQYCSYNPPWCLPWLATNDIMIPVVE
ncbi:hypothetical protein Vretimale_1358 [Volvox reticuliferus]|uniref:SOUL heme-binding protein n=1 Tax=Volvox reticuliferus TaxID=1737510 RepID=A0A8J4CF59_9CHLO|nr:hypothetical protein Vretifemale_10736 [Volvox reticuliferus]GIL95284.1 hypothetical protein Vretimale_1358 [Volvox reticuliferus]